MGYDRKHSRWGDIPKKVPTRYVGLEDSPYASTQSTPNVDRKARKWIDGVNKKVDKYWKGVRAKEIADALATQKRSTKKSKPKPKPKPKTKPAASSTKPYENIPGVDSYVPRERYKPSDILSDVKEGYNYESNREQAHDRSSNYTDFSADGWIADKSKADRDVGLAQNLVDRYKFEIRKNLEPTEESIINALNIAIPDQLELQT